LFATGVLLGVVLGRACERRRDMESRRRSRFGGASTGSSAVGEAASGSAGGGGGGGGSGDDCGGGDGCGGGGGGDSDGGDATAAGGGDAAIKLTATGGEGAQAAGGAVFPIERRRDTAFAGFSTDIGATGDVSIAAAGIVGSGGGGGGGGGGVPDRVSALSTLSGDAVTGLGDSAFLMGRASVGVVGFCDAGSSAQTRLCAITGAPIDWRFWRCCLKKPFIEPASSAFSFPTASLARSVGCRLGRGLLWRIAPG